MRAACVCDVGCEWHGPHASGTWLRLRALEAARPAPDAPQCGRVRAHLSGPGALCERRRLDRLGRHGRAPLGRSHDRSSGDPGPSAEIDRGLTQPVRQPRCAAAITTERVTLLARHCIAAVIADYN